MKAQRISDWILGVILLVSGTSKIIDLSRTSVKIQEYANIFGIHTTSSWTDILSYLLVFIEICIGISLLIEKTGYLIRIANFFLFLFFSIITAKSIFNAEIEDCGCFGEFIQLNPIESSIKNFIATFAALYSLLIAVKKTKLINSKILSFISIPTCIMIVICAFKQPIYDNSNNKKGDVIAYRSKGYEMPIQLEWTNKQEYGPNFLYEKDHIIAITLLRNNKVSKTVVEEIIDYLNKKYLRTTTIIFLDKHLEDSQNDIFKYPTALVDKNFLQDLCPGQIGYIVIKDGIIIEKWQQNGLRLQTLPTIHKQCRSRKA